MKILFANDYTSPGGRHYKAGSTHEVNAVDARNLIHLGKAIPATENKKPARKAGTTSAAAETTQTPATGDTGKE